jgi:molybdopterin molybdotransferase
MISVKEASTIIQSNTKSFGEELVAFQESQFRVLKEEIVADRDFPPFNRVCMDGIAISEKAFLEGIRDFKIEGIQAAGSPQLELKDYKNCIEIMTGSVLSKNADVVIPYELVQIEKGTATVAVETVKKLQNIHLQGKDRKKGEILISENKIITAAEIGVLATVGKSEVLVEKQPKVMIVSTGDELVEVSESPLNYQIRRSNVYSLVSLLKELFISAETAHLPDDKVSLKAAISKYLETYDVLLFSGAVSKGKFDFIPEVLEELGVEKLFHKVKQRPGKPFWFGQRVAFDMSKQDVFKNKKQTTIFAFPGNPISTYVNCLKYFYPWYSKSIGIDSEKKEYAKLDSDVVFNPKMTYFLQVKIENRLGEVIAIPFSGNGSGDLANLADADAFIELPAEVSEFKKGSIFPILRYRKF